MLRSLTAGALCALAFIVLTPTPAAAQIYTWRDASGNLVLSDRPKDPSARTFAINTSGTMRATRSVSNRRAAAYEELIHTQATANGVRPELVRAVIQAESSFNPNARSVKGAMGLMQLMPATAAEYGVVNAYDPQENVRAGVAYLKSLLVRYDDREELALAAYNAGPGAVERYSGIPPYRETLNYVDKIRDASGPAQAPAIRIYRRLVIVEGREVWKYSNVASPGAELVTSASRR